MSSSAASLQNGRSRPVMAGLAYAVPAVALALFLWILWYVTSRLDVGVDVSDSAYHIISYSMHQDIAAQSTLAGWIWAALSPFDGVLANRYLGVVFLLACFVLLILAGQKHILSDPGGLLLAVPFSLSRAMVYYRDWIPDPSYNLVDLGFIALVWAGFFKLRAASLASEQGVSTSELAWAAVVGLAMMTVFLSKATSAAVLGPVVLGLYLATTWRVLNLRRFMLLALAAAIGCAVVFLMLAAIGETPLRVVTTMQGGYRFAMTIAAAPFNPRAQFDEFVTSTAAVPLLGQWQTLAVLVAILLAVGIPHPIGTAIPLFIRVCLSIAAAGAIPVLAWQSGAFGEFIPARSALIVLAIVFALIGIFAIPRRQQGAAWLFFLPMCASLFIYVYGTGNPWGFTLSAAGGFAFSAIAATLWMLQAEKRLLLAIPSLSLLGVALVGTTRGIEYAPYRLTAPLSELKSIAHVGPFDEEFLDSAKQASFYNTLAGVRPLLEKLPERPYLIDLSGRVPMVAYQIGAKPPHIPWLLSGYQGSDEVFRLAMKTIAPDDLSRAWIFQAYGYTAHFPDSLPGEFGLNFPADYVPVVTVPVEYLGVDGTLFAPREAVQSAGFGGNAIRTGTPDKK